MMPLRISKENSTFQILQALKANRSKRKELGEIFVEGVAPIKNALLAGKTVKRIIYRDEERLSDWAGEVIRASRNAQLIALEKSLFEKISDRADPSELLMTVVDENVELTQVRLPKNPFVVVFDRPSNLGNIGSIIRSANAFGVDLIITTGHGVDPFDPIAIRASMGGIFFTKVCQAESMQTLMDWIGSLRKQHEKLSVIGTDSGAEISLLDQPPILRPVVLLIGNEAKGLSVSLKILADKMIKIPMIGKVDSLNAACAASILMFEIYKASVGNVDEF
jgi:TrmH family RNA methyltransferase